MLQLVITAGHGAGTIAPLGIGVHIVGRDPGADIELPDPDASRRHAAVSVTAHGVWVTDLGSRNGTRIDSVPVPHGGAELREGQALRCGDCVLMLAPLPDPPAAGQVRPDGLRDVIRPPRPRPPSDVTVDLPVPPPAREPMRMHWAASVVAAAGGCVLAVLLHSPLFLAFAALGPLTMLATYVADRRTARSGGRADRLEFSRANDAAHAVLRSAMAADLALLRRRHPDPAQIRLIAAGPSCRIWERRAVDADALAVRLGLGATASGIRVRRGHDEPHCPDHPMAPVAVDLRAGPLGIAGSSAAGLGLMRSIVAQLCALHAPGDLAVMAILAESRSARWRWARWLPHLLAAADDDRSRAAAVAAAVAELDRRAATVTPGATWAGPWLVMLIDGPVAASTAGLERLLREGPAAGITAVCLDDTARLLPAPCTAVLATGAGHSPWGKLAPDRGESAGGGTAGAVLLDGLSEAACDEQARALSRLADPAGDGPGVPDSVRLLDLLGLPAPAAAAVRSRWDAAHGLRTPIGSGPRGAVDFDLERDGPHALIAGTTGSGKSELLQGLVAGLAATCPPSDLAFVLIDYKGGASFGACAGLPHVSGLVTDLDSHLTERVLLSLAAELRRREAVLAGVAAKDIAAYRARPRDAVAGLDPLPYLVIVIDEFAALALELPRFLEGLVGVAGRGRSLGVHLILATQRPSGVISPEIRANTSLRVALRMTDAAESIDVIGTAGAASISSATPGRAYLNRTGGGEAPALLQVARTSGSPSSDVASSSVLDGWRRAAGRPATPSQTDDIDALVAAIAEAGSTQPRPPAPWLPPLPESIAPTDSRLSPADERTTEGRTTEGRTTEGHLAEGHPAEAGASLVVLGLHDRPEAQEQSPFTLDLHAGGSVLIAGSARSGRTTALRTVAAAALGAQAAPVDLYVIDCAPGGALRGLIDAPSCGAALTSADGPAIGALIRMLGERIHAAEPRESTRPVLVLIDAVEAMLAAVEEADPGRGIDAALALLRDAASARITIVATGDRPSLAGRVSAAVSAKLLLPQRDPADYALAGILPRAVPDGLRPGRALLAPSGEEVQIAALGAGDDESQRRELDRLIAAAGTRTWDGPRARIRALPRSIRLTEVRGADCQARTQRGAVLGVGGDDAHPVWAPVLAPGARILIAGPSGSGRTSALALIGAQARDQGLSVVTLGEGPPGEAAVVLPADLGAGTVLLVDDCEALADPALADALARVALDRSVLAPMIVAGNIHDPALSFRGIGAAMARRRTGILLCPAPGDNDLLGLGSPRHRSPSLPGRGIAVGIAAGAGADGGTGGGRIHGAGVAIQLALL